MAATKSESVREMHLRHRQEYREQADRQDREIGKAVRTEFPVGAAVKYKHGQNYIMAVVDSYPPFEWSTNKVIARNTKTGNKKEIEAHNLEHIT